MDTDLKKFVDCPKCGERMTRVRAGEIDADRCKTCGGVWLDRFERERLVERGEFLEVVDSGADTARGATNEAGRLVCPRDRSVLARVKALESRGIEMDQCTICGGVYLDPGELNEMKGKKVGSWFNGLVD